MPNDRGYRNLILDSLSESDLDIYFTGMNKLPLPQRRVLYDAGSEFEHVYFPEAGVGSILTIMSDGSSVEVGMIGREGLIGISSLLGGQIATQQCVIQIAGDSWQAPISMVRRAFEYSTDFRRTVNRFIDSFLNVGAQTAACNRVHSIEQRCARWLLMARDRIDSDTMPMTHEFLSSMLGVSRISVTTIVSQLREKRLIHYQRGRLDILNHMGLTEVACECYSIDHERIENQKKIASVK